MTLSLHLPIMGVTRGRRHIVRLLGILLLVVGVVLLPALFVFNALMSAVAAL